MNHSQLTDAVVVYIGPIALTETVTTTWALMGALSLICWLVTRRLSIVPGSLQAIFEILVGRIKEQIQAIVNRDPSEFLSVLGTLFIFLVASNLAGVLPGVRAPTAAIETPAALATIIFFSVHVFGVRVHGVTGYLKSYLEPNPLLLPLNILSEFTRSFSLMMRLFGNIMSDELIIAIIVTLAGLLVPIPFMLFEILVGFVQAYIFSVLAAVYIGGATGSMRKVTTEMWNDRADDQYRGRRACGGDRLHQSSPRRGARYCGSHGGHRQTARIGGSACHEPYSSGSR